VEAQIDPTITSEAKEIGVIMKLYHGQKVVNIYTNNKTNSKKKETTLMEKLQTIEAPKVILSIKNKAAEFVANHYK